MPVVGYAELQITPSFKGLQKTVGQEVAGLSSSAPVKRAGGFMSNALSTALGFGIAKAGGVAIKGLGLAFSKGFGRLQAIEGARAKLTGLGHDAGAVEGIMKNALASVKGTAFGLGDAATVAAGAVAAGIKPGQDLERVLKSTANSAAASGTTMAEMGAIYNKAAASNKAQNDILSQVADKGIPIYKALAEELGVAQSAIFGMAKDGEIDFATFEKAMTRASGTVAEEMGKTLPGAFANTVASIGRVGANLMSGVYPQLTGMFLGLIEALGPVEDAAKKAGEALGVIFEKATKGVSGLYDILVKGEFSAKFREAFGVEEDSMLVGFLMGVHDAFSSLGGVVRDEVYPAIKDFGDFIVKYRDAFESIAVGVGAAAALYKGYAAAVWIASGAQTAYAFSAGLMSVAMGTISKFTGMAGLLLSIAKAEGVLATAQWALNTVMGKNPFIKILSLVIALAAGLAYFFMKTETGKRIVTGVWNVIKAVVGGVVSWFTNTAIPALVKAWEFVVGIFDAIKGRVAGWFNPIGDAVSRTVTPAFELMGEVAGKVGSVLRDAFGAVVDFVRGVFGPAISWISDTASLVWGKISSAVSVAGGVISTVLGAVVSFLKITLGPVFEWLYKYIIKPYFAVIKFAATVLANVLLLAFDLIVFGVKKLGELFVWLYSAVVKPVFGWIVSVVQGAVALLSGAFLWLRDGVIKPVWSAIQTAVKIAGAVLGTVFKNLAGAVRNVLGAVFTWLYNSIIKPIWGFIKWYISTTWDGIKIVFGAIKSFITNVLAPAFTWLYNSVIKPVWDGIKSFISGAWTVIKGIFQSVWNFLKNTLGPVFTWLRDSVIKPVWNGIKSTISSVWNKGIKPVFQALGNFIEDTVAPAFKRGVELIGKFWDGLKDIAKAPVKFIIEDVYMGGIRGTFEKIAVAIGSEARLPEINLPKGFARGGWTGPGSKYQEAGVVHADEFVVRKESQRDLRKKAPGFLDSLNRFGAKALGYADGGLVKPVKGGQVTSGFGTSRGRYPHAGIDFAVPTGTPVFASMAGTVLKAAVNAITGRTGIGAFLGHDGGRNTYYGHLSKLLVGVGDQVKKGQQIALSGNTGNSTGPHLHFETWTGGKPVNPAKYLAGAALPEGGVGGGGGFDLLAPLMGLKDKMLGKFGGLFPGGGMIADMGKHMVTKAFKIIPDFLMEKIRAIGDFGLDVGSNVKDFFNGPDSSVKSAVRGVASGFGWDSGRQWGALSKLISKESSWNPNAQNKTSTAYGLFQFLNSTWAGVGGRKTSDPGMQAQSGLKYIKQRYGDPRGAMAFHKKNNWYAEGGHVNPYAYLHDNGGVLNPGLSTILNNSRKPEAILNNQQWKDIHSLAVGRSTGAGEVSVTVVAPEQATANQYFAEAKHQLAVMNRRGGNR